MQLVVRLSVWCQAAQEGAESNLGDIWRTVGVKLENLREQRVRRLSRGVCRGRFVKAAFVLRVGEVDGERGPGVRIAAEIMTVAHGLQSHGRHLNQEIGLIAVGIG